MRFNALRTLVMTTVLLSAGGHATSTTGDLVLVAGATGRTGQQVVRSAYGYGAAARITALDLSARSLGFAARQARALGIDSVDWLQGDLLLADQMGRQFQIIECIGVLHHMADPFDGWRRLLRVLKPDGLIYAGLYSDTARRPITSARNDPASPGPGCDDAAARAWRRTLLDRPPSDPAASLRVSRNFNALSEFRDLVLHASERQMTMPEIAAFIEVEHLRFLGFMLPPHVLAAFTKRFPDHPLPGRLADWQVYETENPSTFEGMYCFWCART